MRRSLPLTGIFFGLAIALACMPYVALPYESLPQTMLRVGTPYGPLLPIVSLSPVSLNFGSQRVGSISSVQTVTLQNIGTDVLSINGITFSGRFQRLGGTCALNFPALLGVGASCTILVIFNPNSLGIHNGSLSISNNAIGSPHSINMTGIGTRPGLTLFLPLIRTALVLPADDPSASPEMRAIVRANYYRQLVGIAPLRSDPAIVLAATKHANYYVINHNLPAAFPNDNPHGEVAGYPGFSGVGFDNRMAQAGYTSGSARFEVMHFIFDPALAVEGWINTVYHRIPFIDPRITDTGYGQAQGNGAAAAVMDFGTAANAGSVSPDRIIVYPVDGQVDVPRAWSCNEAPNPYDDVGCDGSNPVGYVITVLAMGNQQFQSLELRDMAGKVIPVHGLRYDSAFGVWYAASRQPLAADTIFTATLIGTDNAGLPLRKVWTFKTSSQIFQDLRGVSKASGNSATVQLLSPAQP